LTEASDRYSDRQKTVDSYCSWHSRNMTAFSGVGSSLYQYDSKFLLISWKKFTATSIVDSDITSPPKKMKILLEANQDAIRH
jgi:hypothetical protein